MARFRDITGLRFGSLIVLEWSHRIVGTGHAWECRCDCGNTTIKTTSHLQDKHNSNPSCGCAVKASIAKASAAALKVTTKFHHPWKVRLKWLYQNILRRCYDPKNKRFDAYGGRGITVCDEWREDRYAFYRWTLANGYRPGLQIDRRDNNGPYSPENCRFVTQCEQANNTRKNVFVEWNGVRQTVSQWAHQLRVHPEMIRKRLLNGWQIGEALTTPSRDAK